MADSEDIVFSLFRKDGPDSHADSCACCVATVQDVSHRGIGAIELDEIENIRRFLRAF